MKVKVSEATGPVLNWMVAETEAVAQADAELSNAGLPTYSELVAALREIADEAGPLMGLNDGPGSVNKMASTARTMLARAGGAA